MGNIKPFVFLLLSSLLLVSLATAFEDKDPRVDICKQRGLEKGELKECRSRCEESRGSSNIMEWNQRQQSPQERYQQCQQRCDQSQQDRPECRRSCEETYRREKEQQGQGQGRDPQQQYQECKQKCQRQSRQGQRQQEPTERCEQRCKEQLEQQQQEQGRPRNPTYEGEAESQTQQQGQESDNPYVFSDQHFQTSFQTQHGRVRVLKKFHRQSRLLRGLKNYRFAILEANPQTFVRPHHCDSDNILFVAQGRGTISMVREERRESLNIRRGDVLRIRPGTTVYMINSDNNEKLVVAKLVQPVNVPDSFEDFIPQLYFNALSSELLEAAFSTRGDRLQRFLGQQGQGQQGLIIKASQEQIKGMSHHQQGGKWPFGESKGATNLFEQRPKQSNQYGVLREVSPNDCRELEDLDVTVSYINVTQGAMTTPYYNSRSTKISFVLNGQADMEMACPHLSSSEREVEQESQKGQRQQQGQSRPYQKVRAQLRRGDVIVVPTGHPVIAVASGNQNMEMVCFEINTRNNERVPLAGRTNIWRHLESEAKELAFGIPSREVDSILQNQKDEWFFRGPRQQSQQQEGRADE